MDDNETLGELYEALALDKQLVEPMTPPFNAYGPSPRWWSYYGQPWPARQWSRYPRPLPLDIEYRNTDGKLHRVYGPAYISRLYEIQAWFLDGKRHRVAGPAYIHKNNMVWFQEDQLHRLDGPAVIEGGGPPQYWIRGTKYSKKQYKWEIARRQRKGLI